MAQRISTRVSEYEKAKILKRLKEGEANVLASLEKWEENFKEWKETVVAKFAEAVEGYEAREPTVYGSSDRFDIHSFRPPEKPNACRDYRIQAIHRAVIRVEAMPGDIIKLALNDPVWDYINVDDCL